MNTRNLFVFASLLSFAVTGTGATVPPAPAKATSAPAPVAVSPDNPAAALTKGMPAEAVRKAMGAPAKVTPMKVPDGKAEIWVYSRQISEQVERVEVGTIPITNTVVDSKGIARTETIGEDIQYGDLHRATIEFTELLMFNDHYVTCKTTSREIRHYN